MESTSRRILAAVLLASLVAITLIVRNGLPPAGKTGLNPRDSASGHKLVVASSLGPMPAAFFVANSRQFWSDEGIEVAVHDFSEAKFGFDAILAGKAQLGNVAETPMVLAAMQGRRFSILATFCTSTRHMQCLARNDRGIERPTDLKGRAIAVSIGTAGEYYKDLFLREHGLLRDDVRIINLKPANIVQALVSGEVDGAVTWEPHATTARHQLGTRLISFPTVENYLVTSNVVCQPEFAEAQPELVLRILRALQRSVDYMNSHQKETIDITAKHLGVDPSLLAEIWDTYEFRLTLDRSLIRLMDEQMRWAIESGLAQAPDEAPQFIRFVDSRGLRAVAPEAVTVETETPTP